MIPFRLSIQDILSSIQFLFSGLHLKITRSKCNLFLAWITVLNNEITCVPGKSVILNLSNPFLTNFYHFADVSKIIWNIYSIVIARSFFFSIVFIFYYYNFSHISLLNKMASPSSQSRLLLPLCYIFQPHFSQHQKTIQMHMVIHIFFLSMYQYLPEYKRLCHLSVFQL